MLFVEGLASGIILFPYSLVLYQLVLVGLLPFILISLIPKIKNIFLKKKSIRYWLLSGLLCYTVFALVAHIMLYFPIIRESDVGLMLSGVVFFNMYSSIYLLLFKFLSNNKQNTFLRKKEKYCMLGWNLVFSLLFYTICRVTLEYNLFSEAARLFGRV